MFEDTKQTYEIAFHRDVGARWLTCFAQLIPVEGRAQRDAAATLKAMAHAGIGGEASELTPLSYQVEMARFLKAREPEVWEYVSGHRIERSMELRQDLLRATYRIDRTGHPEVHAAAETAARALGITVPVSIYQAEGESSPNAMLVFVPEEAIVVLHGPILELLDPAEQCALFGHEFAHHRLWSIDDGDHLTADRIVTAMIADDALPERVETGRRLSLAMELLADRGTLLACRDLHVAVATLVKISTTLRTASAESYLTQADEVLATADGPSANHSHPEMFFRAAALRAWAEGADAQSVVERAIRGPIDIDRLDLVDQHALSERTTALLDEVLLSAQMQTDTVRAHRSAFSANALPLSPTILDRPLSEATRRYLAYVLLDFATIDGDLEFVAVQHAASVARRHGLGDLFTELATTELRLDKADRAQLMVEPR